MPGPARAWAGGAARLARLHRVPIVAVASLGLLLGGCGGGDGKAGGGPGRPAQGDPAARHGEGPLRVYERIELARVSLFAAGEVNRVAIGPDAPPRRFRRSVPDVRAHLEPARRTYRPLAARARRADRELGREIDAAFVEIDRDLLGSRPRAPELGRRIGQIGGQLFDAVVLELVPEAARLDPAVRAQLILDLTELLERRYAAAARDRRAFQESWSALTRSAQLARGISDTLGPQRDDVLDALLDLRDDVFPSGVFRPQPLKPAAEVAERAAEVRAALEQRYGLGAASGK